MPSFFLLLLSFLFLHCFCSLVPLSPQFSLSKDDHGSMPRELEFCEHQPANETHTIDQAETKITRSDKETGKMEPAIGNRPGARIDSHITEPSSKGSHHE
ncbi:hypothetical protein GOBAR_DD16010 [Gossypium barbadense]|nr:hypothetical protein GOBAR_DD16010 [Gossypium barbadense]